MALSSTDARKRFEAENKIATEDPDHIYKYDEAKHQGWTSQRLWQKEYLLPAPFILQHDHLLRAAHLSQLRRSTSIYL